MLTTTRDRENLISDMREWMATLRKQATLLDAEYGVRHGLDKHAIAQWRLAWMTIEKLQAGLNDLADSQ